jgi:solute:Na+ symporter, SSS family
VIHARLSGLDQVIVLLYFGFVIGIGWLLRRSVRRSADFLTASHTMPAWITGLAFISANLGAQEVIGMGASGAKYGMMTSHFYWIGAVPAMVFLSLFMLPFYYGSRARSVPEYLKLRFDEKTRAFNALTFALMTILSSGISMHALASLFHLVLGWPYDGCIAISAVVVLIYLFLGGLRSAIYNEVLQFCLIVAGFLPLAYLALRDVGGWEGLHERLNNVAHAQGYAPGTWTESWSHLGHASANPMGVEWFGLVMGLGFVLSFGYWCTDYLVVQRALAAESLTAARRTPLIAAVPKILFPALLIVPGMVAAALNQEVGQHVLPLTSAGTPDYNMSIPSLLIRYFPEGMLGLGFTALMASFMSGMAGNVSAFNTVWTYDLYQSYLAPGRSDRHYLMTGHVATVAGVGLGVGAAYLASAFDNIMDLLQLVFGFVNAPVFATFLLGMSWKRATGHGAFWGLLGGTGSAAIFHGLSVAQGATPGVKGGWIDPAWHFTSEMGQNFYMAIVAWCACFALTVVISLLTRQTRSDAELEGLTYATTARASPSAESWYRRPLVLAAFLLLATAVINVVFR